MVKRSLYADIASAGGFGFDVFTDDEIDKIHLATLEVLEKTGLYVGTDEAMEIPAIPGGGLHPIGTTENHSSWKGPRT